MPRSGSTCSTLPPGPTRTKVSVRGLTISQKKTTTPCSRILRGVRSRACHISLISPRVRNGTLRISIGSSMRMTLRLLASGIAVCSAPGRKIESIARRRLVNMIDDQNIDRHILDLLELQPQLLLHCGKDTRPFGCIRQRNAIQRGGRSWIEGRYLILQPDIPASREPRFVR